MSSLFDSDDQELSEPLMRELVPEPVAASAAGSFALHGALAGALILYGMLGGFFHHNVWGNAGSGEAIQVNLTSALPLPNDQPPNKNVLTPDAPSVAPAAPSPKAKQAEDEKALAIASKKAKPQKQTAPKTQQHQPQPKQDNLAHYGDQQAMSMPRATQAQNASSGPASITVGDFGSRFGYYVEGINRDMAASWHKAEVDPRTPKGARVYLTFTIHRDGTPADVQIDRASGSTTLDQSCKRGVQRVDTFGALPTAYNSSTLKVSFYCEY